MVRVKLPSVFENRLGKIKIAEQPCLLEVIPEVFSQIQFIPLAVKLWEVSAHIVYVGYAVEFERLDEGEMIPEYTIQFEQRDKKRPRVTAVVRAK